MHRTQDLPGAVYGTHDENTLEQLRDVARQAEKVALMADGHLGYIMPIGGVAAYKDKISVVGVGFDIACGNCAIRTDLTAESFDRRQLTAFADRIQRTISFGVGRKNQSDDAPLDHPLFDDPAWEGVPKQYREGLRTRARTQLGTVGSGNHYVDLLVEEEGALWVGVHFGSRGFGHAVASGFLALGVGKAWNERVPEHEALYELASPLGDAYFHLMELAGRYAYAGREWVTRKVVDLLGGSETDLVHNHHNYAWRETHEGEDYIVVRKGATPAFPGQRGFVGGSMGDDSVILRGTPSDDPEVKAEQEAALYSTVHGAGRVMSRTAAIGKIHRKTGEVLRPGRITQQMMSEWLEGKGVILRGGGLDEAPQAYRRLPDVLRAQGSTVEVLHTLKPVVVVMAGSDEFDPYKD